MKHIDLIENQDESIVRGYLDDKNKEKGIKEKKETQWNGKLRMMFNGDIVLPYSCAFVLKRFEDFDSANF